MPQPAAASASSWEPPDTGSTPTGPGAEPADADPVHRPAPAPVLTVPARYNGPTGHANGGYVAGRLAAYVGVTRADEYAPHGEGLRAVTVVLRRPVPLDLALDVRLDGDRALLGDGEGPPLVEAGPGVLDTDTLEPVGYATAVAAADAYAGATAHPMPQCFGCGQERARGDGLRLAPGPVGDGRVAAAWVPDASLLPPGVSSNPDGPIATEFCWTALDCTAAWTWNLAGEPALLGTMTGIVDDAPYVGDRCVAVGAVVSREGRKIRTATALYDEDGRVLGRAQSVWVTVDPDRV